MSVFEVSNYVPEILDLAEFCLNRLAETQNSIKSENCLNQNSGGRSTHRLASVLASLRGIMENDNLSGFLCGSVKKYPDFIENECSVNGKRCMHLNIMYELYIFLLFVVEMVCI